MWAQVATCLDLSYTVRILALFQLNLRLAHWKALIHILGYVKGTLDHKIVYLKVEEGSLKPIEYVDTDFGGDYDTCCLTGGYVFMVAGGPVSYGAQNGRQ